MYPQHRGAGLAIGQLSVRKKKWIPLVHVLIVFLFFMGNSYFLLFCALHFIGISSANLNLGKKRVTWFSIPPIVNIFSDFFCSLCFYSFHILRWDLLRLFGETNGRGCIFRILNYEKKTLYFWKIFFWNFETYFMNTADILILVCIKSLFFFVVFFGFFRFLIGDSVIFACQTFLAFLLIVLWKLIEIWIILSN